MEKKLILLMSTLISILFTVFVFSCSEKKADESFLVMGTSPTFPAFAYYNSEDEITGFDVELAKEIAIDMGKKLRVVDVEFSSLREAIKSGKIDMAICGITITDERKTALDFSIPYYEASLVVLINKDDTSFSQIRTKEELGRTKKLAAASLTTSFLAAKEIAGQENIVEFKSWNNVIDELLNKKVDAVIIDRGAARAFSTKHDRLSILSHIEFDSEYYGIAVDKGNSELIDSINATISRLINSGQYSRLVEEYINSYTGA